MKEQNYKNHRQVVYTYYLFTGIPIIVLIVFAIKRIIAGGSQNLELNVLFLLIGWILLTMLFRSRKFALIAQDRAIRAEESLRYFILTSKSIDQRLTTGQITALRFAGDDEFPSLVQQAIEEKLDNVAIKLRIKNWRSDWNRV
jgi:hypothetical protein